MKHNSPFKIIKLENKSSGILSGLKILQSLVTVAVLTLILNLFSPASFVTISVKAATTGFASGSASIDKYYLDPTNEVKTLVTAPGDFVTVRLKYNNSGNTSATNVVLTDSLPNNSFTYISGSLKNCLINSSNCVTLSDTLFSGTNLSLNPSVGFFGNSLASATGNLEMGKKKFIHVSVCTTSNGNNESYLQSIDNSSIFVPDCSVISGSSTALDYNSYSILGKRYLHQTSCIQSGGQKEIFVQSTDNSNSFTPDCSSLAGSTLDSSSTLDMYGQRYIHQSICLQASGQKEIFVQSIDNSNSFTPDCSSLVGSTLDSSSTLDMLDTTNGNGYIEYQLKSNIVEDFTSSSNTNIGDYGTNAILTSPDFATITDNMANSLSLKVFCDNISPSPGERNISLSDAELRAGQDFRCNYQAQICPVVFADDNTNGVKDSGEALISNVDVQLQNTDGTVTYQTITTNNTAQCFQNLLHGKVYKVKIPLPPLASNTTGGDEFTSLINYRVTSLTANFGYGNGSLYLNAPISLNLPSLTVSATPVDTSGNISPIQVIDTRGANPGWTLTATVNDFSTTVVQADNIPVANKFRSTPSSVTVNDGETNGINIGNAKTISSTTDAMSIFSGTTGNSKGNYIISNNVSLTVPAYIRATNYSTDYIFTII